MSSESAPANEAEWQAYARLPDAAVLVDAQWRVRRANATARAWWGEDVDGASILALVPPAQAASVERALHEATARGATARVELQAPDASDPPCSDVTVLPLTEGLLVILHAPAPRRPVTGERGGRDPVAEALVNAGIALASAHSLDQLLQELVDITRELVGARYAALGVVNDAGTGLADFITSGLTPEQRARLGDLPTGHGILGLLVRDQRAIRLRDLREHPASEGTPRHHPAMHTFMGVPVVTKGRVFGNLYVTEKIGAAEFDDRDQRLVETLAAQAAVAIENAELRRERDRFFAAASHELGNAITGVRVWSRHLLQHPPQTQEAWLEGVRNIAGSADQTTRLIDDLLSLSRIAEGRLHVDPWATDVAAVARTAAEELRTEADAARVRIDVEAAPGLAPVETDALRVKQILLNLLGNAIKFSPAGGRVRVTVAPTADGGVAVDVADEGPGIAPADVERIFRPYEQVRSVARGRGTGLGLPLSRQLARLLGGDLAVESAPGQGATFHLRLPAHCVAPGELPYDKR